MSVWGVVPVAAVVPVFPAGTYRHYTGTIAPAVSTRASTGISVSGYFFF